MLPAFSAVSPSGFGMAWAKCIGHAVDSRELQMFLAEQLGDQLGHETLVMSARGTAAEILFKAHKCHFHRFNGWNLCWGFHLGNFQFSLSVLLGLQCPPTPFLW